MTIRRSCAPFYTLRKRRRRRRRRLLVGVVAVVVLTTILLGGFLSDRPVHHPPAKLYATQHGRMRKRQTFAAQRNFGGGVGCLWTTNVGRVCVKQIKIIHTNRPTYYIYILFYYTIMIIISYNMQISWNVQYWYYIHGSVT